MGAHSHSCRSRAFNCNFVVFSEVHGDAKAKLTNTICQVLKQPQPDLALLFDDDFYRVLWTRLDRVKEQEALEGVQLLALEDAPQLAIEDVQERASQFARLSVVHMYVRHSSWNSGRWLDSRVGIRKLAYLRNHLRARCMSSQG